MSKGGPLLLSGLRLDHIKTMSYCSSLHGGSLELSDR